MILIGIALIPVYGIYKQIIKNETFGDKPASDLELIIIAIFLFLPINVVPVHLPHPLGSRVNLFIDAYLARQGCNATTIPPIWWFLAGACVTCGL